MSSRSRFVLTLFGGLALASGFIIFAFARMVSGGESISTALVISAIGLTAAVLVALLYLFTVGAVGGWKGRAEMLRGDPSWRVVFASQTTEGTQHWLRVAGLISDALPWGTTVAANETGVTIWAGRGDTASIRAQLPWGHVEAIRWTTVPMVRGKVIGMTYRSNPPILELTFPVKGGTPWGTGSATSAEADDLIERLETLRKAADSHRASPRDI